MFTGTNAIDFAKAFPDNESCYRLLDSIKWQNGYTCCKCGCTDYMKGRTAFHRRCKNCDYDESLTANTLFHDMRMPVKKAFFMLFMIVTRVKGMSTAELGRLVGVQQRTGWLFKRKVQVAMKRSTHELSFFELMLAALSKLINKKKKKKRRSKSRVSKSRSRSFINSGNIAYQQQKDKSGQPRSSHPVYYINFLGAIRHGWTYPGTGNQQLLFRSWIGGVHHKCSEALYGCYCDEFAYRFNRRDDKEQIFENTVKEMLRSKPHPYAVLKLTRA